MKKNKKLITKLFAVTSLVVGGGIISLAAQCTPKNVLRGDGWILVQVERDWLPYYETVKSQLLSKSEFKDLGIDVKFKIIGAVDESNSFRTKGQKDKDTSEVLAVQNDAYAFFINQGLILDLYSNEQLKNYYDNNVISGRSYGSSTGPYTRTLKNSSSKIYGLPFNTESLVIYSRKDSNLDAIKFDNSATPQEQWANLLYSDTSAQYGIGDKGKGKLFAEVSNYFQADSFFNNLEYTVEGTKKNLKIINKNGDKYSQLFTVDGADINPKIENIYDNIVNSYKSLPSEFKTDYQSSSLSLLSNPNFKGRLLSGSWNFNKAYEKAGKDNLVIEPLPSGITHVTGGWGLSLSSSLSGKKASAGLMFIKQLTDSENSTQFFLGLNKIPVFKEAADKIRIEDNSGPDSSTVKSYIDSILENNKASNTTETFLNPFPTEINFPDDNFWSVYSGVVSGNTKSSSNYVYNGRGVRVTLSEVFAKYKNASASVYNNK
jgi:hypothetical protein